MTPVEALTQIRALCDEADRLGDPRRRALTSGQVRAVLDAVSVDATPLAVVHVEDPTESGDPWCGIIPASDERSVEGWENATCPDCLKAILREPIGENAQIVNGWLVEPDINGEPEPLIDLKRLPGWSVDATPAQDVMAGWRSEWGDDADYATPAQGIDRDHAAEAIRLARQRWVGGPDYEFDLALADAVLALVRPVEGAHLDPKRAAEVLDWCKREGGLDLYGWGDLISRLQECIVPSPPDAQSKVSDAYRRGFEDARTRFGAS